MNETKKRKISADKTDKKTARANRWKKGQSGNPPGRPAGSRNKMDDLDTLVEV